MTFFLGSNIADDFPSSIRAVTCPTSDYSTTWSFRGDGGCVTSPIIVDQAVFVGSSSGQVYALDAATGAQLWTANAGSAISAGNGNVISALAAGDGLLVVPAGNTLSAFTLSTNP